MQTDKNKIILFQGDSITECGRSIENFSKMGDGYPLLVKAHLGYEYPGKYEFQNRGISGNRIVDVYARIKADITNLKPDYMSILIGVNDVWHELDRQNGVDEEKFEAIYSMLIEEIKQDLLHLSQGTQSATVDREALDRRTEELQKELRRLRR